MMLDFTCNEDNGNTCPHDGARTVILETAEDHTVEACPHCRESFRFWFDDDSALCRCGKPDSACDC